LSGKIKVILPDFWKYEVGNVVRYVFSNDGMLMKEALETLFAFEFEEYIFDQNDIIETADLSLKTQTSFYDASYCHLAKKENGYLVTADKKFVNKIQDKKVIYLGDIVDL